MSRRKADKVIAAGRILINGKTVGLGQAVQDEDEVRLDNKVITPAVNTITLMLNKPSGYVCSRSGQGNKTVYDLLPAEYHSLKPVGRLDMESSGLLLLTSDGQLANKLTHPSFQKTKVYEVVLDKPLNEGDKTKLLSGVNLEDGPSKFSEVIRISDSKFRVSLQEGRNRQIRRTFAALGYKVVRLHRTRFGDYKLGKLANGKHQPV